MKIFTYHLSEYRGWFRIYGYGLKWKRVEEGLNFPQRYGYEKYVIIFGWVIGVLKKGKG